MNGLRGFLRALFAVMTCVAIPAGSQAAPSSTLVLIAPLVGNGSPVRLDSLRGASRVVIFWRSDCAPCLVELGYIADLESATGRDSLIIVALESAEAARATLQRRGITNRFAWVAQGDPAKVLQTVSAHLPRLPLSIALDARGRICRRHVGLLGTERAREWIVQCSR